VPDATKRILIVDDKESIRTTMSLVLNEMKYQVRSAHDGFSALSEIRRENPDILISDLNMPGMSGFELLLVVRRRFPAILVVAMSGSFSGNEVPSGVPADAFYQKGSSTNALLQILRALPQLKRRAPQPCRSAAPLWIQRSGGESSAKAEVTVTCQECLRAFPHALDSPGILMREVDCIHCGNAIQFEIVEPADQMPRQAFLQGARAPLATPGLSTLSN
jgi:CheY-like chemotaxis protein